MRKTKGFTLIELIVVLAIIVVLGAVIVPSIAGYINFAKKKAAVENGPAYRVYPNPASNYR